MMTMMMYKMKMMMMTMMMEKIKVLSSPLRGKEDKDDHDGDHGDQILWKNTTILLDHPPVFLDDDDGDDDDDDMENPYCKQIYQMPSTPRI